MLKNAELIISDMSWITRKKTEKLLVVDHCDITKEIHYARFLTEGPEGFGAQNKGTAFSAVSPAVTSDEEKAELENVPSVFDFIQRRDVENPSVKILGWREIRWNDEAKAYQPKAYVDAIEWFRMPN